jgi:hypothetical protein
MKRNIVIYFIIIFSVLILFADRSYAQFGKEFQDEDKTTMASRFFLGGGFSFWIYPNDGYIYVSPLLGYHLSPSFDIGVRLIYSYYWYDDNYWKFHANDYGAGFFARYYLFFFRNLFLHAEYEFLSHEQPLLDYQTGEIIMERVPLNNFFVGVGYRQWFSQKAFLSIAVLFNLNETEYSPQNPIFRIGIGVGL